MRQTSTKRISIAAGILLMSIDVDPAIAQLEVIVSGSGEATADGTYKEAGTDNGKPYYQQQADPNFIVVWSGTDWQIYNTGEAAAYYDNSLEIGDWVPREGWQENKATGPPTLSGSGTRQPLAGTYTIGGAVPDFTTISAAVDSLNNNGILNDVTFAIRPGTYDEQVLIEAYPSYGSSSDSVLITPESGTVNWDYTGSGALNNYFIRLDQADNITIDGIDFQVPAGTPDFATIISYGDLDNLLVSNCELNGRPLAPGTSQNLVDVFDFSISNVAFTNNVFNHGHIGVEGSQDVLIQGNMFTSQYKGAVYIPVGLGPSPTIVDNTIADHPSLGPVSYVGIDVDGDNAIVARNILTLTFAERGIQIVGASPDIFNNMVAMLAGTIDAGIHLFGSESPRVYNNTVWVDVSPDGYALYVNTQTPATVFNNLLINEGDGRAMQASGGSLSNLTSNFNNLYTTGPFLVNGEADLAAWQDDFYDPDPNSVSKAVTFVATGPSIDLHLTGGSDGDTDLAGIPLTDVPTDIDGDSRTPPPPYMGADQATPLAVDLIEVDLNVLLEGPYVTAGVMSSTLRSNGHLASEALNHPYGGPPWNYGGTEAVLSVFYTVHPTIVDWIYLRLYSGDPASSIELVDEAVAFVTTTGDVLDLDGTPDTIEFEPPVFGDYYLAVYHRNHLGVITADPIPFFSYGSPPDTVNVNGQDTMFGTNPLKNVEGGLFALHAADENADGQVTANDFNAWLTDTKAAATGYLSTDFNMDGQVTVVDFNMWLTNTKLAVTSQIP